jgi:hypothetical protein
MSISGNDAMKPRSVAGVISEMYTGATMIPTPPQQAARHQRGERRRAGHDCRAGLEHSGGQADGPFASDDVQRPAGGDAAQEGDEAQASDEHLLLDLGDVQVLVDEDDAAAHHTHVWKHRFTTLLVTYRSKTSSQGLGELVRCCIS